MRTVLFWDFDGTLAEAPHIWSNTLHRLLLEAAPDCGETIAGIRQYTARIFTWDSPDDDHTEAVDDAWWRYMEAQFLMTYRALGVAEDQARAAVCGVRPYLLDPANYRLYPDAIHTLARCRAMGYENYILSNNFPELPDLVRALGLADYINGCAVSAHAGYDKPRPEFFAYAKQLAGEADVYYMIGDNPIADVEGGCAAGMRTILVHKDVPNTADHVCATLAPIPDILQIRDEDGACG